MLTPQEFMSYLEENGGFFGPPNVMLLKARTISNFYCDQRIFKNSLAHEDMLRQIGKVIGNEADRLGAEVIVGIVTIGAIFAEYTYYATATYYETIDPHKEMLLSGDITGKRVMIVDDTCTSGASVKDAVQACEDAGAIVVGAMVTVRRDPAVTEKTVGLTSAGQEFIVFADIDFPIINEQPDINSTLLAKCESCECQIRLDVGYAAEDDWPKLHPEYEYVGEPKLKS